MENQRFWKIISAAEPRHDASYSLEKHLSRFRDELEKLDNSSLKEFAIIFEKLMIQCDQNADLSQAAFVIGNGCGDDDFRNFSAGLIVQGEELFFNSQIKPDETLSSFESASILEKCEMFKHLPNDIFCERMKDDNLVLLSGDEIDIHPSSYADFEKTYSENEDVLKLKFPKLFRKYWK